MAISFNSVPSNLRVPFMAVEFNNTRANQGPALLNYRGLLIGQKTSAGSATANTLVGPVTSADQVAALAGRGSMLHRQAKAWFAENKSTETWLGVLADNGAGTAAAGTLVVTGPATAAGTIALYLGGTLVSVAVANGDASTLIATNINAAINANGDLPVTSAVTSSTVTVTFRHKGAVGNQFDMRLNYSSGDATPAGVGVAVTALSAGATNPVLSTLIAAMGDSWFQIWAHPYLDSTSLSAIETELASRWGPMRMIGGQAITADNDTVANLATLGESRNSKFETIVATQNSPTPPMEYAASVAGLVAFYGNADPARPFQTLESAWILPPAESDLLTLQQRNTLLYDGVSTTKVVGGVVELERLITTYATNAVGAPDTSYLDLTTMLTLIYARYSFRVRMQTRYPRHKLAGDATRFGPGQAVLTPAGGKAEAILWFRDLEALGLFQNFADFKANLVVEINGSDPNRLDFYLPPDLVGQFIVGAAQIAFAL